MSIFVDTNLRILAPPELRSKYPLNPEPGIEFPEDQRKSPEDLTLEMDEAGVDQACLTSTRYHGFDNSYLADAIALFPERFVGMARINILQPDAREKISYWVEERGLHGVRFVADEQGLATWIDDPQYFPAWERVRELGIPTNAQTTMPEVLPNTRRLLEHFPDLQLRLNNLAHVPVTGGAGSEEARDLLCLAEYPRTYVNFPVGFIAQSLEGGGPHELLLALLEAFGTRRLIWTSFGRQMKDARDILLKGFSFLSDEEQSEIFGEGACDLYPSLRGKPVRAS